MTHKEIREKRGELNRILKEEDAGPRLEKLQPFAKEVGASITRMGFAPYLGDGVPISRNIITEDEIVHNIAQALQTWTMVDMCKTAARNFWIAVIASLIALLSMIAAWVAVLR